MEITGYIRSLNVTERSDKLFQSQTDDNDESLEDILINKIFYLKNRFSVAEVQLNVIKDYENVKVLLSKNGTVIFDDYDMEDIYHYLNRKLDDKEIYLDDDECIRKNNKQCIYKYT